MIQILVVEDDQKLNPVGIWKVCTRILPGWSPGSRQMRRFMKSGFLYVKDVII